MAYLTLTDSHLVSNDVKEKIAFYVQYNRFSASEFSIKYKTLNDTPNQIISSIKKTNKELLKQINFLYLDDTADWDVICVCEPKNPMIIINLKQISQDYKCQNSSFNGVREAIAYATIFGFLGVYFGTNFCVNCFGELQSKGQYTMDIYYRYKEIVDYLFLHYKDEFMFFMTSSDEKINKVFMYGKKYVFTLAILLKEERISLQEAAKLLNLNEDDTFYFLDDYKGVAYIALINHKTGVTQ